MSLVFNDFAYGKLFHPDLLPQTNISRMTSVYEILGKFFQLSELFLKMGRTELDTQYLKPLLKHDQIKEY